MHALKITINQGPPTIAGAGNIDILNAMITCRGKLGPDTLRGAKTGEVETFIDLGGMTLAAADAPAEHVRWIEGRALRPGDIIRIEMLDSPRADPIVDRFPVERPAPENAEEQQRRVFEHCKHAYFALKEKYEADRSAPKRTAPGMRALHITVNDRAPVIAGANDLGVLIVSIGARDANAHRPAADLEPVPEYYMDIGGLTSRAAGEQNEHLSWGGENRVRSGDVVTVEIIDAERASPPYGAKPADTPEQERALFEEYRRKYLALKDQYESA